MTTLKDFNRCGEELERLMRLRTSPIAVNMLEKESDIPEGAIRPYRDRGIHIAQCQAFAMSRRQKETIAMLKEDNWCFAALIAYGGEIIKDFSLILLIGVVIGTYSSVFIASPTVLLWEGRGIKLRK